jgi:hypothetical protein
VGFLELCGFLELLYVAAGEKKIWQRVGDCLRVLSEKKQWLDHVIFIVLVVVASFGNDATRPMTKIMSRILVEILRERERAM